MKTKQKPTRQSAKKTITLVIPAKPAPSPTPAAVVPAPAATPAAEKKPKAVHPAVAEIAAQLGESKPWPMKQIKTIVWALGATQARELAARAQEIHAGEGMLVKNGSRKKTLGGIWFALAYTEGKVKEGRTLVKPDWKPKRKQQQQAEASTSAEQS